MARHNEIGTKGESLAIQYLKDLGHSILEQNWRSGKYEIDIISKFNSILIFTEVKTRTNTSYGEPTEFLSPVQEKNILLCSQLYMEEISYDWEIRFDLIGILFSKSGQMEKLEHFKDVFY